MYTRDVHGETDGVSWRIMMTLEWMRFEEAHRVFRFRGICQDGVPLYLPNHWLWMKFQDGSPNSVAAYGHHLVPFFQWMEVHGISLDGSNGTTALTRSQMFEFRAALNVGIHNETETGTRRAASTNRQSLATVIRFLEWVKDEQSDEPLFGPRSTRSRRKRHGLLAGISFEDVDRIRAKLIPKAKKQVPKYLTSSQVQAIREWIDQRWSCHPDLRIRNRAIFEVYFATGVRKRELCALRIDGWDSESRTVTVPYDPAEYELAQSGSLHLAALVKTGERQVVLSHDASALLNQYVALYRPERALEYGHNRIFCLHSPARMGRAITPYAIEHLFELMNLPVSEGGAGIDKWLHPHLMRHTHATFLADREVEDRAIQQQLGHKDYNTTVAYQHVSTKRRRKAIDAAFLNGEGSSQSTEDWGTLNEPDQHPRNALQSGRNSDTDPGFSLDDPHV